MPKGNFQHDLIKNDPGLSWSLKYLENDLKHITQPFSKRPNLIYTNSHLDALQRVLDKNSNEQLKKIPIVDIILPDLNGHSIKVPEKDESMIILNMYNGIFLGQLNMLYYLPFFHSDKTKFDYAVQRIVRWARISNGIIPIDQPQFDSDLDFVLFFKDYREMLRAIIDLQEMFIIAHEIGHQLLDHRNFSKILKVEHPTLSTSLEYMIRGQKQEYDADDFAITTMNKLIQRAKLKEWHNVYNIAINLLFIVLHFLEAFKPKNRSNLPPSHPLPLLRKNKISRLLPKGYEELTNIHEKALQRSLETVEILIDIGKQGGY